MNAPIELRDGQLQGLEIGPALAKCNDRERAFVVAFATGIAPTQADAAKLAGYGGGKDGSVYRRSGYNVAHRPHVIEAIEEVARRRFRAIIPKAITAAEKLIEDPAHKDHAKAVLGLLSKLGYGERTAVDVTVSGAVQVNHTDQAVEDLRIMKEMGVPQEKLVEYFGHSGLGRYQAMLNERNTRIPKLIEAKAEEITEAVGG